MDAKICDRCGTVWYDCTTVQGVYANKIKMHTIQIVKGSSFSDIIGSWDLCDSCNAGLFEYLKTTKYGTSKKRKRNT
jgi:hypothetical protein